MIENRKEGLGKVTKVMSGIRDLAQEFGQKVELQGDRLEEVDNQLDEANAFTNQGAKELNTYANTMKGRGIKMAICLGIMVLLLLFLIFLIFR
jgi:t-SNARE complex subunit (syntaxin)